MPASAATIARHMTAAEFRAFQDGRPEHERWELIAGVPVMMVPPLIVHNLIATNLTYLLSDALAKHDPSRCAIQRSGVELGLPTDEYRPEPDVMVIDLDFAPDQRFVERAYLLAEIVSSTDREPVPGGREPWINVKRRLYKAHSSCDVVLVIEQVRVDVQIETRVESGWRSSRLSDLREPFSLPGFGLHCRVADLYAGTPHQRSANAAGQN
jgi:Uma2 family endonuclease